MSRIRALASAMMVTIVAMASPATASEQRPYDAKAFAIAQQQGRPILVDAYADWCPTCRAQAPIITNALRRPEFSKMIVFKLNFDTQVADSRRFGIRSQSTIIAFNGRQETGRSVGDTNPDSISKLMRGAAR